MQLVVLLICGFLTLGCARGQGSESLDGFVTQIRDLQQSVMAEAVEIQEWTTRVVEIQKGLVELKQEKDDALTRHKRGVKDPRIQYFVGKPGLPGRPGAPGLPGRIGPRGVQGHKGVQGAPGLRGPMGPYGPPGWSGPPGFMGAIGLKGAKGDPGFDGVPGLLGDVGFGGFNGEHGAMGVAGYPGPQGFIGLPGYPGESGDVGIPGPPGEPGAQGNFGLPGPVGLYGFAGEMGERGFMGPPGELGPKGDKGDRGMEGDFGPWGPVGAPGPVYDPFAMSMAAHGVPVVSKDQAQHAPMSKVALSAPPNCTEGDDKCLPAPMYFPGPPPPMSKVPLAAAPPNCTESDPDCHAAPMFIPAPYAQPKPGDYQQYPPGAHVIPAPPMVVGKSGPAMAPGKMGPMLAPPAIPFGKDGAGYAEAYGHQEFTSDMVETYGGDVREIDDKDILSEDEFKELLQAANAEDDTSDNTGDKDDVTEESESVSSEGVSAEDSSISSESVDSE